MTVLFYDEFNIVGANFIFFIFYWSIFLSDLSQFKVIELIIFQSAFKNTI